MTVGIYFGIAALIAAYFGLHEDAVEQGDWPKAGGLIVMCALWPVMIGLGAGLGIGGACRAIGRAASKLFDRYPR